MNKKVVNGDYLAPGIEVLEILESRDIMQTSGDIDNMVINGPVIGDEYFI